MLAMPGHADYEEGRGRMKASELARRGYTRALRFWRKWDRMMDRVQENVGYLFMESIKKQETDLLRRAFGSTGLPSRAYNTLRNRTTPNSPQQS